MIELVSIFYDDMTASAVSVDLVLSAGNYLHTLVGSKHLLFSVLFSLIRVHLAVSFLFSSLLFFFFFGVAFCLWVP